MWWSPKMESMCSLRSRENCSAQNLDMNLRPIIVLLLLTILLTGAATLAGDECDTEHELAPYVSRDDRDFVKLDDGRLLDGDKTFAIRGINYYPMRSPWRRFLLESDSHAIRAEFELIRAAGINSLRIFLWNGALFLCEGTSMFPNADTFARLDQMLHWAGDFGLRLIVTLNDLPDLENDPLYDNSQRVQEQTRFIVSRYSQEPTILAWDLRNEGDIDYGSRSILQRHFPRMQVLDWLRQTATLLRSLDGNHLVTAGWLNEAHSTAPYVDFVSFHHWSGANDLQRRIRGLRLTTAKPLLLQEVGYSAFADDYTPDQQADALDAVILVSERADLLGWMIWTAFDFPRSATCYPSPCQSLDNIEHHFGIWTSEYEPKPAVEVVRKHAG